MMEGKIADKKRFAEKLRERGFFRPCALFSFGFFALGVVVYLLSRFIPDFAEFWARYPSQGIRFLLAKITGILPFSFAEFVILTLPISVAAYFIFSGRSMKRDDSKENYYRWLIPLVCVLLVIAALFLTAFGPCYFRYSLAENLDLTEREVTAEELYLTAEILNEKIGQLESQLQFDIHGACIMPYDYNTLVEKINDAYETYGAEADYVGHFDSYAKPMAISNVFTYTHISGIYTFMTGEVNINTNYPDFVRPFTVAHEFSHQRGIAREDEANFVAYLVCIGSEDAFVQYSGYVSLLQYVTDALYEADKKMYEAFYTQSMHPRVVSEFRAYSNFFEPYRSSAASEIAGAVNDTFLNSQGQTEGRASYGLVVDLAVAYYLPENLQAKE